MKELQQIWIYLFLVCFQQQVRVLKSQRLSSSHNGGSKSPTCEPIKIDLCRNIGYNLTGMPNLANNILQADANMELETYMPMLKFQCANELQFFLCSVYVPICTGDEGVAKTLIGPCRPMCERVKSGCLPLLKEVKLPWPEHLKCSKFPEKNDMNHMCMEGPGKDAPPLRLPASSINDIQTNPMLMEKMKEQVESGTAKKLAEKYDKQKSYLQLLENQINKQEPAQV